MYKKYIKRILDFIISLIAVILLTPVYLIVALLIKLIDKNKVLFKQSRTGLNGNDFQILKFRTMKNGKVTKLGQFLRTTSIDETPQFFNVLKGDMSLVGPRPWITDYYKNFNEKQKNRVHASPGLVGLAQVSGRRDIDVFRKINLDLKYVNNINFITDLKIIIKSLKVIISRENFVNANEYISREIEDLKFQDCAHRNDNL